MSKEISFCATRSDLLPVIKHIEENRNLKYIKLGDTTSTPVEYLSALDLPNLGVAFSGKAILENKYVVFDRSDEIHIRTIFSSNGDIYYKMDQEENPKSIIFAPGGLFNEHCLIAGHISTISNEPASIELYQIFRRVMTKKYERIGSVLVGTDAATLLDSNGRLTLNVRASEEYDLKR